MTIFERWYFGLCWNLRLVIISWRIFGFFWRIFWRFYFCMVKYLSFHNSCFALRCFLKVNGKGLIWISSNKIHLKIDIKNGPPKIQYNFQFWFLVEFFHLRKWFNKNVHMKWMTFIQVYMKNHPSHHWFFFFFLGCFFGGFFPCDNQRVPAGYLPSIMQTYILACTSSLIYPDV